MRDRLEWELRDPRPLTIVEGASGSGDLVFEEYMAGSGKNRRTVVRGFLGLGKLREAEEALNRAKEALRG